MLHAIIGAKKYLSLENLPKPFVYIDPRFLFKNIPADKKGRLLQEIYLELLSTSKRFFENKCFWKIFLF